MTFNRFKKRIIVTMDLYNGEPVLVQRGKVITKHSNGSISQAFNKISIFPDILVVDLNGAFGENSHNREIINKLATNYYIHSGGGLRTLKDVQDVLQNSARRIVISSNTSSDFISKIPKERLIVELSVDEHNNILTHGRKVNTRISIFEKLELLSRLGVEAISITFHHTEGLLNGIPREQVKSIMSKMPLNINKVIIAGGLTTLDDLEFLWSLGVIPQLGSAIWKNKLKIGEVYNAMIRWSPDGLVPTIIQDKHGLVKGLVYMNPEAINKTCQERYVYRYSRKLGRVIQKGETSGNRQKVLKMSLDCDSDALLITVDTVKPFCHTENYSCFSLQTVVKANLGVLKEHIESKVGGNSYSGRLQKNPGLALAKLMEEFWEIVTASRETQVLECADLLVHLLMYINGMGIQLDDILNELNARRWNPHLIKSIAGEKLVENNVIIAITPSKYTHKTDKFAETELGVKIKRGVGRNMRIDYDIINKELYNKYFQNKKLILVTSRPKDMPWLMAFNRIDGAIGYNTVFENYPKVYNVVHQTVDNDLFMALIKRGGDIVDPTSWTSENKGLIATEHIYHVSQYMKKTGLKENQFSLDRIIGSSEGYMVNTMKNKYQLCDAIVESGKTLKENNLSVWRVILPKGQIKIGLYINLN